MAAIRRPRPSRSPYPAAAHGPTVGFTIAAKVSTTIKVTVQLKDQNGGNLAQAGHALVYLSDNADGSTLVGTAPSGGWSIAATGLLLPITAGKYAHLITGAAGLADINVVEAGTKTVYLVVLMPDGSRVVSAAVTF